MHNKHFFKRWSTWQNIFEAVGVVLIQALVEWPDDMTNALWAVLALRILMAASQAIKQGK